MIQWNSSLKFGAAILIALCAFSKVSYGSVEVTDQVLNELLNEDSVSHMNLDCHVEEGLISRELPTQLDCVTHESGDPNHSFQIYLRMGADVKNGILGSVPTGNQAALDLYVALPIIGNVFGVKGIEVTPSYESFERIGYSRAALEVGKVFEWGRWSYSPGVEVGRIERKKFGSFYDYSINNTVQFKVSKGMAVGLMIQAQNREDLNQVYGLVNGKYPNVRFSNFLFVTIRLN